MSTDEDSHSRQDGAEEATEPPTRTEGRTGDPASIGRRRLLQVGAAAGAGALGFGGVASADHNDASPADREVDGDACLEWGGGELNTGDVTVINNDWSTQDCPENVEMCISTYGDGSFGWEWSRGVTCQHGEDLPNYPQALMGSKIGGQSSGWRGLPEQVDNIDSWDVQLDVEQDISDGEWNFMLEWWMEPNGITSDPTDEILIVLDDSELHTKGGFVVEEAIEDDYGNTIGYWENQIEGGDGADWNFHIFKYRGDGIPSHVDLRSILDYLIEDPEGEVANGGGTYDGSKTVSGVEIGNEVWDNTDGETIVDQFNVRVETSDGQEHLGTAGVEDSWSEPENLEPSAPSDLAVDDATESSVSLSWSAASDPDGSVDHYEVAAADAGASTTTSGTSATLDGLDSGTDYEVTVTAVDDEGATSSAADVTATTEEDEPDACEGAESSAELENGQPVCDVNGDGDYRDVTGDGVVTNADVTEFFGNQHVDPWNSNDDMFDFTGDGQVTQADVIALFETL